MNSSFTATSNRTHLDINKNIANTMNTTKLGDKYFIEQRNIILQDINNTMDSILNGLNELNISLESSIAVGKDFESVALLWKTFYNEHESIIDGDINVDEDEDEQEQSQEGGKILE
ncbi:Dad1p PWA37_003743 [Arxiozyma heterogenica]